MEWNMLMLNTILYHSLIILYYNIHHIVKRGKNHGIQR